MTIRIWLAALGALAAAAAPGEAWGQSAATTLPEARDERPLLWRGLRAGMSPREALAALRAQGIRAELAVDPETGREFVETPRAVSWAGRPYLIAMGFVDGGLFYVDINSHRLLSGRIAFERSHFSSVARLLAEDYGPPVQISPEPLISAASRFGVTATATARFERGGLRADLTGHDGHATFQRDVSESVSVRFWRVADAEAFAAAKPDPRPAAPTEAE